MEKLLLLEDDISLVEGLCYSLKKNGFQMEVARTIGEAEKKLGENGDFDLLLFDVTLRMEIVFPCAIKSGRGGVFCLLFFSRHRRRKPVSSGAWTVAGTIILRSLSNWGNCVPESGHCLGAVKSPE